MRKRLAVRRLEKGERGWLRTDENNIREIAKGHGWPEDDFEQLKLKKLQQVAWKHKNDPLDFEGCLWHLFEEFGELILAVKKARVENIEEELADLSNCCKFTFLALNQGKRERLG